ncbi:MAG: aminotransferase class I/II-fold pyridoxal phosphate-dependent enzyme, partial [Proteobacteria bacterium]|nr:aminotransferase class I/II-fold pyridoxal phosphate-dependent enzyme [Pseudomonadota bacterium]
GYGAGPKTLIKAMNIIQSQSTSNACSISQAAAISALEEDQEFLKVWRNIFQRRRNIVVEALNQIPGLTCRLPEGAFYVYVNCKGLLQKITPHGKIIQNDQDVASYFLDHANVAVVHGEAFGLCPYFRLSYATTTENLLTGCQRLALAINQLTDNRLDFSQA